MKKLLTLFILSLGIPSGFSQSSQVKKSTLKTALDLSNTYSEKALWFKSMDHYNADSSLYYINKAFEVLDDKEPLHQTALKSLHFKKISVGQDLSPDQASALSRAYHDISWNAGG